MTDWNLDLFKSSKPFNTGYINKVIPSTNGFLDRALTEFLFLLISSTLEVNNCDISYHRSSRKAFASRL